jgi:hypothetical protein
VSCCISKEEKGSPERAFNLCVRERNTLCCSACADSLSAPFASFFTFSPNCTVSSSASTTTTTTMTVTTSTCIALSGLFLLRLFPLNLSPSLRCPLAFCSSLLFFLVKRGRGKEKPREGRGRWDGYCRVLASSPLPGGRLTLVVQCRKMDKLSMSFLFFNSCFFMFFSSFCLLLLHSPPVFEAKFSCFVIRRDDAVQSLIAMNGLSFFPQVVAKAHSPLVNHRAHR